MGELGVVLLIDVAEDLSKRLRPKLNSKGVGVVECDASAFLNADIAVSLDATNGKGNLLRLPGNQALELSQVRGTLAGGRTQLPKDEFDALETVAIVQSLRMSCPNPLNYGRGGSYCAYAMSLPEQWAACEAAMIKCPGWYPGVDELEREDCVWISNVFDRSIRQSSDTGRPLMTVRTPYGAAARCAFFGSSIVVSRWDRSGMRDVELQGRAYSDVAEMVESVRTAFSIDFGEILFTFLGVPVFWSVTPFFSSDILSDGRTEFLLNSLSTRLIQ